MVSDTDIQQERIRQERRRRGEGDVTEDLLWAGAFDPYTVQTSPVSYGDTGLAVTTNTPVTLNRSITESPVTEASTVNPSLDTSSMIGGTSLASTLPVGTVDDSSLTASVRGGRAIVEPQSDNETYNLWSQTEYYSEHFRPEEEGGTELGNIEESLENNAAFKASWVEASRRVYEMHYGREVSSRWSDDRIAEWGLDYMREFNGALVTLDVEALGLHGGMTNIAMKVRGGTDAQKQAFGYLMDSLDEADLSTSGALSFAGNMLVDPTTYLGLGTFGAGTAAAQGAKVAARQGVKQVVRHTMREGLRRGFATTIREGAEAAIRAPLRSRITTAALIAGTEGAVYGLASDANMQSVNISMGRQESYSLSQAGLSAGIGFAAGGVLGGGMTGAAPYIGKGTAAVIRPIENRVIRPTASFLRNSTSRLSGVTPSFRRSSTPNATTSKVAEEATARTTREASENATTRTTRTTSEQTTSRTTTEGPSGRVDGDMEGPFTPGGRTTFAAPGKSSWWSRVTRGPGDILPEGNNLLPNPTRTWIHNLLHYNPYHWIGYNIGHRVFKMGISNPANNLPIDLAFDRYILPFIDAVDTRLLGKADTRLAGRARTNANLNDILAPLQKELKNIQSRVGGGSSALTPEQAKVESLRVMQDFVSTHRTSLKELSDALQPIADEMALEKELARITSLRKYGDDARPASEVTAEVKALIDSFEASSGRTFDGKAERIASVVSGADRQFFLTQRQSSAMSEYVNTLQRSVDNLLSSDFAAKYERSLDDALSKANSGGTLENLQDEILHPISFLSQNAEEAAIRMDPKNHDASHSIRWRTTQNRLQDVNAHRIALRNGYFNPHRRTLPISSTSQMDNMEAIIMRIEEMDPTDAGKAGELEGLLKNAYELGEEHEALEALKRLNDRTGLSAGNHALLDKLKADFTRPPAALAGGGEHYNYYARQVAAIANVPHSPYTWGQRDVYDFYTRASYKFRHARKYPAAGNLLSTPGEVYFFKNPSDYIRKSPAWLLGGRIVKEPVEDAHGRSVDRVMVRFWDPKKAKELEGLAKTRYIGIELAKSAFIRAPWNIARLPFLPGYAASKFLMTNGKAVKLIWVPAGAFGAAALIEEGAEMVLPHDTFMTDEEGNIVVFGHDLDLGSRGASAMLAAGDLLLAPVRWNLQKADEYVFDAIDGTPDEEILFGLKPDHISFDWNLRHVSDHWLGDRFEVNETDVREALQDVVFDGTTPFHTLPPAQQNAIVSQLAQDDDLSEEHISEVYRNVISSGAGTQTTPQGGQNQTQGGGQTQGGQTQSNGQGGQNQTQGGGQTQGGSTRTRTYSGPQQSVGEAAGDIVGTVGNAAFGWMGDGLTSSVGNFLSGTASWIGGFFNKLASGQVRNGEKWLAGGMGLLAALVGGPMITKALGLDGVPFVGLIIAGLVFGFGGGLAHDFMTGQGSGNHRPNRARRTQQNHDGTTTPETPETPQSQVLATDNSGDPEYEWDTIRASDSDTNGKFAVQMSMDPNKESFVDLRVLNPTEVAAMGANAQDIVNQAIAEGRFISNDRLAGMQLDSFDKWEFTAVNTGTMSRPDNEVLVFAKPDNSNDYVVLELDQPN